MRASRNGVLAWALAWACACGERVGDEDLRADATCGDTERCADGRTFTVCGTCDAEMDACVYFLIDEDEQVVADCEASGAEGCVRAMVDNRCQDED